MTIEGLIARIGFSSVAASTLAVEGRQMELGGPFSLLELLAHVASLHPTRSSTSGRNHG